MMGFFRTRLGKILIWQNFLKRESPALKLASIRKELLKKKKFSGEIAFSLL